MDESTALAKPIALRPTIVSRLALGLAAAPAAAIAFTGAAWLAGGAITLGFAGAAYAIGRGRLTVDAQGVRMRGAFGERALAWSDITHYTYWSGPSRASFPGRGLERAIDGPYAGVTTCIHKLVLHGAAGRLTITSRFKGADRAVTAILGELHTRFATKTAFAPFTLADDGLHHTRVGVLPWPQLELVRLVEFPAHLQVMKHGKSFAWAKVSMAKLHDGLLLLERFADRGVRIELGRKQLVTRRLVDAIARAEALPRAEVRRR